MFISFIRHGSREPLVPELKRRGSEKLDDMIRTFREATWNSVAAAATVSHNDSHFRQRKHADLFKDFSAFHKMANKINRTFSEVSAVRHCKYSFMLSGCWKKAAPVKEHQCYLWKEVAGGCGGARSIHLHKMNVHNFNDCFWCSHHYVVL